MSSNQPRPGSRLSSEERKCDACGRTAICVLMPKGAGQTGALCLACIGKTLGGLKADRNW
jgi:hypothetical protein